MRILDKLRKKLAMRNSAAFVRYLKGMGCEVGEGCIFYEPATTTVDLTRPYLVSIGNRVRITKGVTILSHGFEWGVLRDLYGRPYGNCGPVTIGNNVFIGMHSLILKNAAIGNNVIIGAGSVVSGHIPDNSVAAGNPVRVLCSVEEYHRKMVARQEQEAKAQARAIQRQLRRAPRSEDFHKSYFHLFMDAQSALSNETVCRQLGDSAGGYQEMVRPYENFEAFEQACASENEPFLA